MEEATRSLDLLAASELPGPGENGRLSEEKAKQPFDNCFKWVYEWYIPYICSVH